MRNGWLKPILQAFQPLVSVIIPVHNVDRYLRECLDSVIAQCYRRLQIIAVDDGSTDSSADILREYAKRESRLKIITQANRGLGAARNAGLRRARGKFLFFVDSDDTLPPKAIETLVQSFRSCRADFAAGNLRRVSATQRYVPRWAKTAHQTTQLGTNARAQPCILYNVFAWTKMYRADFFRSVIGEWPEGVLYEDQLPAVRAYLGASSINILNDVVYNWRIREEGTSITQNKTDLRDLQDRISVMHDVFAAVEAQPDPRFRNLTYAKWLGHDFLPYYEAAEIAGSTYLQMLSDAIKELTKRADAEVWRLVHVHERLKARAAARRSVEDLRVIGAFIRKHGRTMAASSNGERIIAQPEYLPQLSAPACSDDLEVSPESLLPDFVLLGADWTQGGHLCVRGEVRLPLAGLSLEGAQVTAEMVNTGGTAIIQLPTVTSIGTADPEANFPVSSEPVLTFSTSIDPRLMPEDKGRHRWMCRLHLGWGDWKICSIFNKLAPDLALWSHETEHGEAYSTFFAGQTGLVWKRTRSTGKPLISQVAKRA